MGKLTMEYRRLDDVVPADENPKGHKIGAIIESIKRRGFADGLVEDGRTGKLVGGHGRLQALQQMRDAHEPEPEGIMVSDAGWFVPVQVGWRSKNDADARAMLVALNKIVELGGWDEVILGPFLRGINDDGELIGTGFNEHDLKGFGDAGPDGGFGGEPGGGGPREGVHRTCPKCGFQWTEDA